MKRFAVIVATLTTFACTSTTPTATPVATQQPPAATQQQQCGDSILSGTLWLQSSAEYRAVAWGTYAAARRALDRALADPAWSAAAEQSGSFASLPPAVILDLDETSIDNGVFEARAIKAGKTYDDKLWDQWVAESAAIAVPGAPEFLAYAKSKGVTPFYITNRDNDPEGPGTLRNLQKLGFPLSDREDTLLMRGDKPEWTSDKSGRRAYVAQRYRVLVVLGDDLNDFANAREATVADRDAIMERTRNWWGERWFMLPNPLYGSWERALLGSAPGDDCVKHQRKRDALRVN
ncbi:MAG TPA: HAD family acid phosphatase [Thermoanaerobaculia bacterium]|jgi:acid phosphatase